MSNNVQPPIITKNDQYMIKKKQTLGSVRQRHEQTNEIILIPTASQDPNDPLNWFATLSTRPCKA